jgi:Zn-dependent protease
MPTNADELVHRLMMLIPLWLSLTVHEFAHAWAAKRLGDDTAERLGRLTLNPLAHIDPLGTLILPLLGVPFGWAKPVPVQPHRFYPSVSMRTGMMLTAVAGPLSNIGLTLICMVVFVAVAAWDPMRLMPGQPLGFLLPRLILLNVILASFNALPIPPLDGSRVVDALVPSGLRPLWEGFCRLGPLALVVVIALPAWSGINLFYYPLVATTSVLHWMLTLVQ